MISSALAALTATTGNKTKLGGYVPLDYNGRILKDKPMAFYLTTTFEKQLFN